MEKETNVLEGAFGGLIPNNTFGGAGSDPKAESGYSEELTDEELAAIRKQTTTATEEDVDDQDEIAKLFETEGEEKKKPGRPKKEKPAPVEEVEEEDDDDDEEEKPLKEVIEKKAKTQTKKVEVEEEDDDDVSQEEVVVSGFFGAMVEKMGWELEDNEETPKTAEGLIDYFAKVIEEQSVPEFANDEIAKLDAFVKNGGNIRDYLEVDSTIDLDSVKLEDNLEVCKSVVKEFLAEKGFSKAQIDKKITKYEDADILEDEAEDALEGLKEIRATKKEKLLLDQQKLADALKQSQQKLFNDVVTQIKGLTDIRGVKIPEKDKKALVEYIFKPAGNGKTKYHQDYASNYIKNLIESAYFTMNGDTLVSIAKQEGSTSAVNKFKESLNNKRDNVSKKTRKQIQASDDSIWGTVARNIRGMN